MEILGGCIADVVFSFGQALRMLSFISLYFLRVSLYFLRGGVTIPILLFKRIAVSAIASVIRF